MSDMTLSISNEQLKQSLFAFLSQKYVQTADDRQKAMSLQYMTAETHGLCEELTRFIGTMGARVVNPVAGSAAPADPCAKGWYAHVLRLAELYGEQAWNDGVEYQKKKKHANNPTPPTGYPDDRTTNALHALLSAIAVVKQPTDSISKITQEMRDRQMHNAFKSTTLIDWADRLDAIRQPVDRASAITILDTLRKATDEEFAEHADGWLDTLAKALTPPPVELTTYPNEQLKQDLRIDEIVLHIERLCVYAHEMGYHEIGYDPVAELRSNLKGSTALVDPCTKGWYAALADARYAVRKHDSGSVAHTLQKLDEIRDFLEGETATRAKAVAGIEEAALATPPAEPTSYPAPGSIWAYKGDPARLYEVMHIANVAHRNEAHAPHVVYRTCRKPENIWVRTVVNFNSRFVLVPAAEGN